MIDDFLHRMPHEYGSVDSVDYMMAALDLSSDLLSEGVLGDPDGFLNHLARPADEDDDDPISILDATYACDGVANEVREYLEGGE
jgi:hypothetical protein